MLPIAKWKWFKRAQHACFVDDLQLPSHTVIVAAPKNTAGKTGGATKN